MLTSRKTRVKTSRKLIHLKTSPIKANVYQFPEVQGLEDISTKMAAVKAETLFSALLKGYDLSPIENEEQAKIAERFLEYLLRAFENECPEHVKIYLHLLEMLTHEYDKLHTVDAMENIAPHRLLQVLLEEQNLTQKSLVPSCFNSQSQVSEFLAQKKGREKLTADQAVKLGKKFHLDPLLFLGHFTA